MATYVIGDVQGCYEPLMRLLESVHFDPAEDSLWFTGDLVNRGPSSLAVLRFVSQELERARVVLGNHDLHLLARAEGVAEAKKRDTLDEVLAAEDLPDLVAWLRAQPLLYQEADWILVHAGLPPNWTAARAREEARRVERHLQDDDLRPRLLDRRPADEQLDEDTRCARRAAAILTNLRCVSIDGEPELGYSGPPSEAPPGLFPWYVFRPKDEPERYLFGHWAALGFQKALGFVALDSGCVWGKELTALRLEDQTAFCVPCRGAHRA